MHAARLLRFGGLAISLLAAAPALAFTVTVQNRSTTSAVKGNVVSAPAGINCTTGSATGCSANLTGAVTFTASSVANAKPASWSGCTPSADKLTCTTNITANKYIAVNFTQAAYTLTARSVIQDGATVTLSSATTSPALNCASGDTCQVLADVGSNTVITAAPGANTALTWVGCASVVGNDCTVAMTSAKTVTVTASPTAWPVSVALVGGGTATATGIACPGDCDGTVAAGGTLAISATPNATYSFVAWNNCSSVSGAVCTVQGNKSYAVTAVFEKQSCSSCHGTPPPTPPHVASSGTDCAVCHPGYTSDSVNAAVHMNGVVDGPEAPAALNPADDLKFEILGATLAAGSTPVVQVKVTDGTGAPVTNFGTSAAATPSTGTATSGVTALSLGVLQLETAGDVWFSKLAATNTTVQSTSANAAATSAAWVYSGANGIYTWTGPSNMQVSGAPLVQFVGGAPQNVSPAYDPAKTTRITLFGKRVVNGIEYPAADTYDFVPNGGAMATANTVLESACAKCHGAAVNIHSKNRSSEPVCVTCHNPSRGTMGTVSTTPGGGFPANTTGLWDLKNMVHGVHDGKVLRGGAAGAGSDFSAIAMAPSHSTYFEHGSFGTGNPTTVVVHDTPLAIQCEICHNGSDAAFAFSKPSRVACGSCHTNVNFATGVGHDGGIVQADDNACFACHPASGNVVYSGGAVAVAPVPAVHGRFWEPQNKVNFVQELATNAVPLPAGGHNFQATLVDVTRPAGGNPTFTVDFALDGQPLDIKNMNSTFRFATCAFTVAGPTTDYVFPATGGTTLSCTTLTTWAAVAGTPGRFTYSAASTALAGLPEGYFTASFEIMIQRVVTVPAGRLGAGGAAVGGNTVRKPFSADPNFLTVRKAADGAVAVVTGAEAAANKRRAVVSYDKCNSCHVDLGFHSNRGRQGPDYCAMCHNPKLDNGTRARVKVADAPGGQYLPESVSMNVFIHRIHMGAELPSVQDAANASPLAQPGKIVYGATRSGFVGVTATTPPEFADLSHFEQPTSMARCDQCHVSNTWGLPATAGLAPVERTYRVCTPAATQSWEASDPELAGPWCNNTSTNGPATGAKVVTPPLKAVCTSCHDDAATNAHADANTTNPMTAGATELCASCHGAGQAFDANKFHNQVP